MFVWITKRPCRWQVSKQHETQRLWTGLTENTVKQTTETMNLALKTTEARETGNEWNNRFCGVWRFSLQISERLFFPFFLAKLVTNLLGCKLFFWSNLVTIAISSSPLPRTSVAPPPFPPRTPYTQVTWNNVFEEREKKRQDKRNWQLMENTWH